MILHGPPGSGKTTLARIVASASGYAFEEESAVEAGRAEVRAVVERARTRRRDGEVGRPLCRVVRGVRNTRQMSVTSRPGGSLELSGDLRVQLVNHRDGRRSYVVLDVASASFHVRADLFLASFGEGTQRTYAYHLVDHLRWLAALGLVERVRAVAQTDLVLVHVVGGTAGEALGTHGARQMIERAGRRAGLGLVKPHAFRHTWATALTEATGGNTKAVADEGGWSSSQTVEETYAHLAGDPMLEAALGTIWGEMW